MNGYTSNQDTSNQATSTVVRRNPRNQDTSNHTTSTVLGELVSAKIVSICILMLITYALSFNVHLNYYVILTNWEPLIN